MVIFHSYVKLPDGMWENSENRTSQISWKIVLFLRLFCGPLRGSYKVPTWRCVGTGNVEALKRCYHRDEG